MTARHCHQEREDRRRRAADQNADEQPERRRPAHRKRQHVYPRADAASAGIASRRGQDQSKLQIEPGEVTSAPTDRAAVQDLDDLFQIHRQNLVRGYPAIRQS